MSSEKNELKREKAGTSPLSACEPPVTVSAAVEISTASTSRKATAGSDSGSMPPHAQIDSNKFNTIKKHLFGWKNKKRKARKSVNVWDKSYNDDVLMNLTKRGFWQSDHTEQVDRDTDSGGENCDEEVEESQRQRLLSNSNRKLVEIVKHNNNINYYCDASSSGDRETGEPRDTSAPNNSVTLTNGCDAKNSKTSLADKFKKDIFHRDKRRKGLSKQEPMKRSASNDSLLDGEDSEWRSDLKYSKSFQNISLFNFNNDSSRMNLKRNISVGDEMYSKDTIVCFNDKLSGIIETKVYKRHSSDNLLNPSLVSILCNSSKSVSNQNRRKSKVDLFLKSLLALTTGKKLASGEVDEIEKTSEVCPLSGKEENKRPKVSSPSSFSVSFNELNAMEKNPPAKKNLCKSCSDISYVSSAPYCKVNSDSFSNLKFIDSDCSSSILNNSINSNLDEDCSDFSSLKASSLLNSNHPTLNLLETDENVYEILENKCSMESLTNQSARESVSCIACIEKSFDSSLGVPSHTNKAGLGGKCARACKSQSVVFRSECSSRKKVSSRFTRPQSVVLSSVSNYQSAVKSAQDLCCGSQSDLLGMSSSHSHQSVLPVEPVNRLRVPSVVISGSKFFSTCSSLLSMASSSKYSISSSAAFIPIKSKNVVTVLCKVCLNEVELKDSWTLQQCNCTYCVSCVRAYVEFEINQGAYHISCPDAQCKSEGIIQMEEIESLVNFDEVEKHKRFKLNKEVELDKSRVWCPRPGCETICTLDSTVERTVPQCVHCPTCSSDFCSNCRAVWHPGTPCRQENLQPSIPGVSFDSELIKCCPMCSVPIEKDEGCAQMMCKRCKHVFCWYCLASLDDDFLLRHYDKGPCKNKLGHSRASVIWHRTQVIGIFAGFGILLLIASPLLLLAAPCIICCKCRVCTSGSKLDGDDLPEDDLT